MRVLHIIGDRRPSGPAAAALQLARALSEADVTARLQCVAGGELERLAREAGVLSPTPLPDNPAGLFSMGAVKAAVSTAAADLEADILHVHRSPGHLAAARLRGAGGPPVVRTYHRGEAEPPPYFTRWLMGWRTSALVAPSIAAAEAIERAIGRPAAVMPGIVDPQTFSPGPDAARRSELGAGPDDVLVGAVGRFSHERRLDELIFAFPEVNAPEGVALRGVILGRGPEKAGLEQLAREFVPDGRLRVVETTDDFAAQIAALDIGLQMTPGSDGTCRTVLEMMSCGLAVVVGAGGALPEVVSDGETGRVADLGSKGSVAGVIAELVADEELRRRLGEAARAEVLARNASAVVAERYRELYSDIMKGQR